MRDFDKEIAAKQAEIDRLLKEKEELERLDPSERMAEYLHSYFCHASHVDRCGWDYSSWLNPCDTRRRYLADARRVFAIEADFKHVVNIMNAARDR